MTSIFGNGCPTDECFNEDISSKICVDLEEKKNKGEETIVFFKYYNDFKDDGKTENYIGKYSSCNNFMGIGGKELQLTEAFKVDIITGQLGSSGNTGTDGISKFVFDRIEKSSFIFKYEKQEKKRILQFNKPTEFDIIIPDQIEGVTTDEEYKNLFKEVLDEYLETIKSSTVQTTIPEVKSSNQVDQSVQVSQPVPETPKSIEGIVSLSTVEQIIDGINKENPTFKKFPGLSDVKTLQFGLMYEPFFDSEINQLKMDLSGVITELKTIKSEPEKIVDKTQFDNISQKFKQKITDKKLEILNSEKVFPFDLYTTFQNQVSKDLSNVLDKILRITDNYINKKFEENKIKICYYVVKNYITNYLHEKGFLDKDKELTPAQIKTLLRLSKSQFDKLFDITNNTTLTINKKSIIRIKSDILINKFKSQGWLFVGNIVSFDKNGSPILGFPLYINSNGELVTNTISDHTNETDFTRIMTFKLFHNYKTPRFRTIISDTRLDIPIVENSGSMGGRTRGTRGVIKTISTKTRKLIKRLLTRKKQQTKQNKRRSIKNN